MKSSKTILAPALLVLLLLLSMGTPDASGFMNDVRPSVKPLDLSAPPDDEDLVAAGQLGGPLHPTHELKSEKRKRKINASFGKAIQAWNKHEYPKAVGLFRRHVKDYPDSPWASEAILHAGCDATYNGRYTEAEEAFRWIISENQGKDHEGARSLLNKARLRLGTLKVYQNDLNGAEELFGELKQEGSRGIGRASTPCSTVGSRHWPFSCGHGEREPKRKSWKDCARKHSRATVCRPSSKSRHPMDISSPPFDCLQPT
jgi:hypothetical protein